MRADIPLHGRGRGFESLITHHLKIARHLRKRRGGFCLSGTKSSSCTTLKRASGATTRQHAIPKPLEARPGCQNSWREASRRTEAVRRLGFVVHRASGGIDGTMSSETSEEEHL